MHGRNEKCMLHALCKRMEGSESNGIYKDYHIYAGKRAWNIFACRWMGMSRVSWWVTMDWETIRERA